MKDEVPPKQLSRDTRKRSPKCAAFAPLVVSLPDPGGGPPVRVFQCACGEED
jgi:hypothetical protein